MAAAVGAVAMLNLSLATRPHHYGGGYAGEASAEVVRPKLTDPPEKIETLYEYWWVYIIVSIYLSLWAFLGIILLSFALFGSIAGIANVDSTKVVFQVNDAYFQFNQAHPRFTGDDVLLGMDVYVGLKLVSTTPEYADKTGLECKIPLYRMSTGVLGYKCHGTSDLVKKIMKAGSCSMTLGKMTCANYSPELGAKYLQFYRDHCTWFPGSYNGNKLDSPQVFLNTYGDARGTFIGKDNNIYREVFMDWSPGQLCNNLQQSQPDLFDFYPSPEYLIPITGAVVFITTLFIVLIIESRENGEKKGRNQMRAEARELGIRQEGEQVRLEALRDRELSSVVAGSHPRSVSQSIVPQGNLHPPARNSLEQGRPHIWVSLSTLEESLEERLNRINRWIDLLNDNRLNSHTGSVSGIDNTHPPSYEREIPDTENKECPITLDKIQGEYSQCSHCHKNFSRTAVAQWRSTGHTECPLCRGSLSGLVHYKTSTNGHTVVTVEEATQPLSDDASPPPSPPPLPPPHPRQQAFAAASTSSPQTTLN